MQCDKKQAEERNEAEAADDELNDSPEDRRASPQKEYTQVFWRLATGVFIHTRTTLSALYHPSVNTHNGAQCRTPVRGKTVPTLNAGTRDANMEPPVHTVRGLAVSQKCRLLVKKQS